MKQNDDIKVIIKGIGVLSMGFVGIVMLAKGMGEQNDLLAIASVFVLLFAFALVHKFTQDELDKKSGLDKAIKDEMEEQRRRSNI